MALRAVYEERDAGYKRQDVGGGCRVPLEATFYREKKSPTNLPGIKSGNFSDRRGKGGLKGAQSNGGMGIEVCVECGENKLQREGVKH